VHEEEKRSDGMFSQARAAGLDMDELGARMIARKEELLADFNAKGLPSPETRTLSGQTLEKGTSVDEKER
jgi:hypothetical protein